MGLHPVLAEKLTVALDPTAAEPSTLRDARLPDVPGMVHAVIGHLVDAFLISALPLVSESERQQNSNPRKLYPADPGLIKAFDASGRAKTGHALETVVFNELARRGAEVGYVRTADGRVVDFLARHVDSGEELIQVCADPSAPETLAREVDGLGAASTGSWETGAPGSTPRSWGARVSCLASVPGCCWSGVPPAGLPQSPSLPDELPN